MVLSVEELLRAPLTPEDTNCDVKDQSFLNEFESAWCNFLKDNPLLLLSTERVDRLERLQKQLREVEKSRDTVEAELQQQLNFFSNKCEGLEDEYGNKMQDAIERQRKVNDEMQKRLDVVSTADHLQQQTLPWHYFVHELDQVSEEQKNIASNTGNISTILTSGRGSARPSERAMVLTDTTKGCPSDILLRASRIDHALLSTHIKMLTKEVERFDKMHSSQEMAAGFLTEYNIWSILSQSDVSIISKQTNNCINRQIACNDSVITSLTDNTFCLM